MKEQQQPERSVNARSNLMTHSTSVKTFSVRFCLNYLQYRLLPSEEVAQPKTCGETNTAQRISKIKLFVTRIFFFVRKAVPKHEDPFQVAEIIPSFPSALKEKIFSPSYRNSNL